MNDVLVGRREGRNWIARSQRLKRAVWSLASSVSLGGLYAGRICPTWIRFTRLEMALPHLPAEFEGHRLVQISDVHYSPIVLQRYLEECIAHINAEQPDFVALTGDFITGGSHYAARAARILSGIQARVACVACLGNHDYGILHPRGHGHMRHLPDFLSRRLEEVGIHVLRNRNTIFGSDGAGLQFVGLEDLWAEQYDAAAAFAGLRPGLATIALSHNPDTAGEVLDRGAHWVLSGHTHGNQLGESALTERVFPKEQKHFSAGHYRLENGDLYVNRGLSYARRISVNKRPEITIFTLRRT